MFSTSSLAAITQTIAATTPDYQTPTGPSWLFQPVTTDPGAAPNHQQQKTRIRRLPAPKSLLTIAAILRHAGTAQHPNLLAPHSWALIDDALWLAAPTPPGQPLHLARPDRLTWQDAVEIWLPLAKSLAQVHIRGIVHGLLSPHNVWFCPDLNQLTATDLGCWPAEIPQPKTNQQGSGLLTIPGAATQLSLSQTAGHPEASQSTSQSLRPTDDVYGLARILLYLTLPPAEALRPRPSLSGIPAFAIPAIDRALNPDPGKRPQRVEELIDATIFNTAIAPRARINQTSTEETAPKSKITDVTFRRVHGREDIENKKFGHGLRFHFTPQTTEETEDFAGAFFYEGVDADVYQSVRWAWDGATINLFDAGIVEDSNGRRFITSNARCLPVIEPFWPVSVTDVLKAEGCTSRVLVDARDGDLPGRALVFGSLVHALLEDLNSPNPPTLEESLEQRLPKIRLDLLAAGLTDQDLPKIYTDARTHFQNLLKFTAPGRRNDQLSRVGWSGRHVEATRYSSLFGLEGRIDLVTEDEHDGLQIIELKSGKPWDDHLSQVRSYTLLWNELAATRGLSVAGHVLYSLNGRLNTIPLEDTERERRILRGRNELVACYRSSVDPGIDYRPPHFMENPKNCNAGACRFRKDRCHEQTNLLGLNPKAKPEDVIPRFNPAAQNTPGAWHGFESNIVRRAWAYHAHFDRLLAMERWLDNAELGLILQPHRLQERIENRSAAANLSLVSIDPDKHLITLRGPNLSHFTTGDHVLAHRGNIDSDHILRAFVQAPHASQEPNTITIHTPSAAIAQTLPQDGWILDILPSRIGQRAGVQALYKTIKQRDPLRLQVLLDPASPAAQHAMTPSSQPVTNKSYQNNLNATQQRAVHAALTAPAGALIQGPPGTGKTTVIAHLVCELVARGQRVVLCALTNTAVDAILTRLADLGFTQFLRIGSTHRSPELAKNLRDHGLSDHQFFTENIAQDAESLADLERTLLNTPVFACTAHASVNTAVLTILQRHNPTPFDVVIVDEAGQLTEPLTLGPLNLAKRFVLVGDHRQLPPIIKNENAQSVFLEGFPNDFDEFHSENQSFLEDLVDPENSAPDNKKFEIPEALHDAGIAGLDRSLFERLITHLPHTMLDEQYRMNEPIMAFSNAAYYSGRLHAHPSVAHHQIHLKSTSDSPTQIATITAPENPLVFVDIDTTDHGRTNPEEARAILQTVRHFIAHTHETTSIGIVTPFRAQVHLIRELLRTEFITQQSNRAIDVDTVERFQGSERDIILVSLVKTERAGEFLSDERRLNVTLTRARKKLIVFGNRPCLEQSPMYRTLIEQPQTLIVPWFSPTS